MLKTCLRIAAVLAGIGAFLWVAGPALSTDRYVPRATDFEQQLPGFERVAPRARAAHAAAAGHAGARSPLYRSAPVEAPKRFDLVGLDGETGNYELRVRSDGEDWSEWIELGDGSPLYTGGSDQVQVRSSDRRQLQGRLHYVNVSGDATPAGGILNDVRGAINGAVISAVGGAEALASSPKPRFVKRSEWGANARRGGCKPRTRPQMGKVKAVVVHHTVSTNNYSEAEAPGIVLGICRYHRNSLGWNDIGYNALVDRFGNVYQGRAGGMAKPVVGAQAEGHNSQTAGVATIANHAQVRPAAAEKRGLISYIAWRLDKVNLPATGRTTLKSSGGSTTITPAGRRIRVGHVLGHRNVDHTECPGDYLYKQLPRLKRAIQARIDANGGSETPGDGSSGHGGGGHDGGSGGGGTAPRRHGGVGPS